MEVSVTIAAALCWYDETPAFLGRCVASVAGLADILVTADGGWRCYPDARGSSPPEQQEALRAAADNCGILQVAIDGDAPWDSQVEKRKMLMDVCGKVADWTLVIDADEYLTEVDAAEVRRRLEQTDLHVGCINHVNLHRGWTADNPDPPRAGMNRRFYRSGTTVIVVHSGYIRYGEYLHTADVVDLRDVVTMEHDNWNRGEGRNLAAKEYRRERERARVEVWL